VSTDADNRRALGMEPPAAEHLTGDVAAAIARAETTIVEHDRRMAERRWKERRAEAARYSGGNRKNGEDRRQGVRR
jgi:hypothetical protein